MASSFAAHLKSLLEEASAPLGQFSVRRMFGSDAFFTVDTIYALVWDGRIAVKISDESLYAELLALPGAARWSPTGGKMSGWLLVPEEFHDDTEALAAWTAHAHRLARERPKVPKKPKMLKAPKAAKAVKPEQPKRPKRPRQ